MPASGARARTTAPTLALLGALAAVTGVLELTGSASAFRLVPVCLALGSGVAAVAVNRGAARLPGRAGRPWRGLALATALLAAGQCLAVLRAAGGDRSAGGVEDLPTLVAVPVAMAAAAWLLPPPEVRRPGSRVLLDGAVVALSVGLVGHVLLGSLLTDV
jgi:hypothetical protein